MKYCKYRYSFWENETVMAFSLVLPTLLSLVSPKLGKFNVTDKGDLLDKKLYGLSNGAAL